MDKKIKWGILGAGSRGPTNSLSDLAGWRMASQRCWSSRSIEKGQ